MNAFATPFLPCLQLKSLYVAITRAKKNLWIADCSEKAKSMKVRSYSIVITRSDPFP